MRRRAWSWNQAPLDLPADDAEEVERQAMRRSRERYERAMARELGPEGAAAYRAERERIEKERQS